MYEFQTVSESELQSIEDGFIVSAVEALAGAVAAVYRCCPAGCATERGLQPNAVRLRQPRLK
jgi:hypothetical protein